MSEPIARLVALANESGLHSEDGQWSEAFVHWFRKPMPDAIREAGQASADLEHFLTAGTPHTPENEGFIDRAEKIAITFETGLR